jgi:integrase
MPRTPHGFQRRGAKWRMVVRVNGRLRVSPWGRQTLAELQAWRTKEQGKRRRRRGTAGSLLADVDRFLAKPEIAAQKYVHQIAAYLMLWVAALGGERPRASITKDEIETVIQGWLKRFKEPTVYHRRSALLLLYTTLDGEDAVNPVHATTCPKAWIRRDHSVPYATLRAIVDAMPDVRYVKKGIRQPSVAKLVAGIIIAVGIRAADLLKVRRRHIDLDGARFIWPAQDKGTGVEERWTELSTEGVAGFAAYIAAGMPPFTPEAVSRSFKRAARRIDGEDTPIHLYSMRHSLGADVYREKGDTETVGRLLGHASGSRCSAQYAIGAHAEVDRAAVAAVSAARAAAVHVPEPTVTALVTEHRKPKRTKALRKVS